MKFLYVILAIFALAALPPVINFIASSTALTVITLIVLGYICYRIATSPSLAFGTPQTDLVEEPQNANRQYCRGHVNHGAPNNKGYYCNH